MVDQVARQCGTDVRIGYPQGSSSMISGRSSAHIPCASHAIGLTRNS
jgi:hypothetical protein